ncbi:MAG TPA: hypothetical protein DCP74_12600 [Bacteroidales bacterium]|nr:hypothetical protein [Bacteroidales bacterium]
MKKLIFVLLLTAVCYPLISQVSGANKLQEYEKNGNSGGTVTATLTSSSRLFGNPDDLTSVIVVIPKGSSVTVLDSDSAFFHVLFEEDEGFINRLHAVLDKTPVIISKPEAKDVPAEQNQPVSQQKQPQVSRFSYLESKYGTSMAARINAGKIWKGMNAGMVKDSWGKADKITREISGNTVKEEWIYRNTWLYLENNTLVGWGPVAQ